MSYKNPIPIILDEEDEQLFYEPLTRLLNDLLDEKIIIYGENYFSIKVPIENLPICINRFRDIGLLLTEYKIECTMSYGILELNAKTVFEAYFKHIRKRFFNLLRVDSELPKYLNDKEKMSFCKNCYKHTCMDDTPYCVKLYVENCIHNK